MSDQLGDLLLGALVMTCFIAAVLFAKMWRLSRDRFFVWFALAFLIFGVSYAIRTLTHDTMEHTYYVYMPRVVGFLLILFAIFDKNRRGAR
ncbi:MAG TPA: DUF5985 family protein [Kofleriaceae bacterium]|nr:DUF5985 family protein [Kofleriaceae bacterium]